MTKCELLVIGGGPAGLAAASLAARHGLSTVLVDERPTLGGQIYKRPGPGFRVFDAQRLGRDHMRGTALIDALEQKVTVRTGTSVLSLRATTAVLFTEASAQTEMLCAERVLVAAGAHDRPVAFPGWTLPGVITAGGAQAVVKTSRVAPGNRVVFAGSGPLALAFPAQLRHHGLNVLCVLEAGPPPGTRAVLGLTAAAWGNGELLRDGLGYRLSLRREHIPFRYGRIVLRAEGRDRVEAIVHARVGADWRVVPGTEERIAADTLCIGYGFVPSIELLRIAGCEFGYDEDLGGAVVQLDDWFRTSIPGVLAAGDGTGVRGALVAADQGRLAALGAAIDLGALPEATGGSLAKPIRRRLAAKERFRRGLGSMYAVGPGIYELATGETIVCRCEEVTRQQLDEATASTADANVVKSYTRAGMGLCQGRNCQRQIAALLAQRHGRSPSEISLTTARPPARPVPLGALADDTIRDEGLFTHD
ncbi:MAG: FAD-dependent oxidoreductase [Acidimicrobiales bacterium]